MERIGCISGREEFSQYVVDELGVGLSTGRFHDLPLERVDGILLASFEFFHGLGMVGDYLGADGFQFADVGGLLEPFFLDHDGRHLAAGEDFGKNLLGDVT